MKKDESVWGVEGIRPAHLYKIRPHRCHQAIGDVGHSRIIEQTVLDHTPPPRVLCPVAC